MEEAVKFVQNTDLHWSRMSTLYKLQPDTFCLNCKSPVLVSQDAYFDTRFGITSPYWIAYCDCCGLEQTVPLPSNVELKSLYETYYNFGGEGTNVVSIYERMRKVFQNSWLWNLWLNIDGDISFHLHRGQGRLLDVGCNEGRGLTRYQNNGYLVEGLELNSKAADVAKSKGFVVHSDLIELFVPVNKYDVVVLSNVLEHSLNPAEMLTQVAHILNPGGMVWISCPNSQSWLRFIFGRNWINWHVPFHISHFSPQSLKNVLQISGFKFDTLRQETPSLWFSLSILASIFSKRGKPTNQLRSTILVAGLMLIIRMLCFPLLFLGNQLGKGDCLVCIAIKR